MPCFFFHLSGPGVAEPDELGAEFATVESAYLDACRAIVDISTEMLRERRDPSRLRFDVCDAAGVTLMEIPFYEVLQPQLATTPSNLTPTFFEALNARLARSRELRAELSASLVEARNAIETAREVLRRSDARCR